MDAEPGQNRRLPLLSLAILVLLLGFVGWLMATSVRWATGRPPGTAPPPPRAGSPDLPAQRSEGRLPSIRHLVLALPAEGGTPAWTSAWIFGVLPAGAAITPDPATSGKARLDWPQARLTGTIHGHPDAVSALDLVLTGDDEAAARTLSGLAWRCARAMGLDEMAAKALAQRCLDGLAAQPVFRESLTRQGVILTVVRAGNRLSLDLQRPL